MLKTTFLILVISGSFSALSAQSAAKVEDPKETMSAEATQWAVDRMKVLDEIVGLTPEQKERITEINLSFARRLDHLQNVASVSEEAIREHTNTLFELRIEQYQTVLTEEQKQKMDSFKLKLKEDNDASVIPPHSTK